MFDQTLESVRIGGLTEIIASNIDNTEQGAKEFTRFPELPPEIRIKIWKWAAHIERIVDVQPISVTLQVNKFLSPQGLDENVFVSACSVPTMLHVSHEGMYYFYTEIPSLL